MKTTIILGGWLSDAFLQYFLKNYGADCIIVADGALEQVDRLRIQFQYLVGDFDTIDPQILQRYENDPTLYVERHIPEKNETDSELAMWVALSGNPDQIDILGATGGRMDHTLGNIELLYQALERGISCSIYDEYNRISLIKQKKQFYRVDCYGTYISFLPFLEQALDVNLRGFKYPLTHARLHKGSTLAISNELQEDVGEVEVGEGLLLCIEASDRPKQNERE